jgi:hypothetical protein
MKNPTQWMLRAQKKKLDEPLPLAVITELNDPNWLWRP